MNILKVSNKSNPKAVAGALTASLRNDGKVHMQAIGAASVNQAVKSIAIARGFVAANGFDLVFIPAFIETSIDGNVCTGIKFIIERR